jgi:hypothetical protein
MKNFINPIQKYFWLASAFFIAMPLVSCKKTLQPVPYSYFTTANFFTDENQAYMATLGVYDAMSSQSAYGSELSFIADNDTDISQTSGIDLTSDFRVICHYQGTEQTTGFYTMWSALYSGIDRANSVIEQIPAMALYTSGTASQKADLTRMVGEAKFLRGFYYSELVKLWGDVPFKLTPSQTGDDFKLPRTDRYTIYAQAIKDMQDAIAVLPTALPTDERICKWGAEAMLARVALNAGGYSENQNGQMVRPANYLDYYKLAQAEINDIMAQNLYKLNPDYTQVFKNQCQGILEPTESMFEVAFYNAAGTSTGGNWLGQIYGAPLTAAGVYSVTNGRELALRPFYQSFATGDLRRDFSIAIYTINAAGAQVSLPINTRSDEQWTSAKWSRQYQQGSGHDLLEISSTNINTVIMRYSDLLLLRAEVENEINGGPNQIAYDAINMVRRRAFGKPVATAAPTVDLAGLNYTSFFTAIKNERAWELCFEGERRADLIRWNILGPTLLATKAATLAIRSNFNYTAATNFIEGTHELYPIPVNERDINPNVGQNHGY